MKVTTERTLFLHGPTGKLLEQIVIREEHDDPASGNHMIDKFKKRPFMLADVHIKDQELDG